ncbi:IS3 family transposase [Brevibacillus laterosporus]|uniref:IS3 family transposase n=1 Tax=Brevibacillus laterosporus TaxID=1465 RepID=UPI000EAB7F19|nr:IS3 family transposase [Brevibacillus laterosporus]AYK05658.1 IS3 family transposase [Brevibacillus laterosporus]
MEHKKTNKRYNEDFKRTVVDIYHSGYSVKELSSEYGISEVTIYKWIKEFTPLGEAGQSIAPKEIATMQKGMFRLKQENEIPKKGYGHIREKVEIAELNQFIAANREKYSVQTMCEVLNLSRSTYYQFQKKEHSPRHKENQLITKRMIEIYQDSKGRYGAPKIHYLLNREGFSISQKKVQRLMIKADIRSITRKKFRPQGSKDRVMERPNLLQQDFKTTSINEKWVADITYIHTLREGWCYLASVLDLHSKKIIGYSFSRHMTVDVVLHALKNAYDTQKPARDLVLHTDLVAQYTSKDFTQYVKQLHIVHSCSRKGCPYDNACIESFHAILKKEEVNHVPYIDYESAKLALFTYIEGWYNRTRIHGSLGYKTPQEVEDLQRKAS